jgi:Large eukaryotic DNA virus major capsid protein/Major capsid protein N-terminus
MAGGLMQLVAYGAQDVYLTGQPKVTFFQAVYKRHTNFAMEAIQQTVNGSAANGARVSVTIARNGDLVGDMWVQLQPTPYSTTTSNLVSTNTSIDMNFVAERAVAAVELTIGGQRIDKHYQAWFRLYAEVFLGESDKYAYGKLASLGTALTLNGTSSSPNSTNPAYVYLPLLFFFNRNPGLYLPLIALQYHEVRLDFDLTAYYQSYFGTNSLQVWANYVYLDTEERRRFAQKGHEYLIEQVQHTGGDSIASGGSSETSPALIRLSFNHPVKEFIWCYQNPNISATSQYNGLWNFSSNTANVNLTCNVAGFVTSTNYLLPHLCGVPHLFSNTAGSTAAGTSNVFWIEEGSPIAGQFEVGPLYQFKLVLNGQDRFAAQSGKYFNSYQTLQYHTGTPYPGIYVYSFALKPEEHQPTGTCNFSRIDNAQVSVNLKSQAFASASAPNTMGGCTQKLFAVNYNILRIQSGMGGLAFSN